MSTELRCGTKSQPKKQLHPSWPSEPASSWCFLQSTGGREAALLVGKIVSIMIKYLHNTYPLKQSDVGISNLGVGEDEGKIKTELNFISLKSCLITDITGPKYPKLISKLILE